jgi:hypothetical protein
MGLALSKNISLLLTVTDLLYFEAASMPGWEKFFIQIKIK